MLTVRPSWHHRAACHGRTDMFFSDEPDDQARAARICARCPVKVQCLAAALTRSEREGVWGGYTVEQRRRALARLRKLVRGPTNPPFGPVSDTFSGTT